MQGDGPQTADTEEGTHLSFFSLSTVSTSGYYFQVLLCSYFSVRAFLILKDKVNNDDCLHKGMVVISVFIYIMVPCRLKILYI
jgi:hypothetical protein